jgi:hypothetical protein
VSQDAPIVTIDLVKIIATDNGVYYGQVERALARQHLEVMTLLGEECECYTTHQPTATCPDARVHVTCEPCQRKAALRQRFNGVT